MVVAFSTNLSLKAEDIDYWIGEKHSSEKIITDAFTEAFSK